MPTSIGRKIDSDLDFYFHLSDRSQNIGRIYKRGKVWWIQYYRRGQLFRESSRSDLKSTASSLLKKREGDIVDGRIPSLKAEKTTFEDLRGLIIQDYEINRKKSQTRVEQLTQSLTKFFKSFLALEITTQTLHDYIAKRQKEKAANGTINRELMALKRMFNLAARQTPPLVLSIPYIPHLKEDNIRKGFFTEEEYKLLRAALPDHLKVPFIIAYWTGMRAGEIVNLKWKQVNIDEGWIRLEPGTTKNGRGRLIPLFREVRDVLQVWKNLTLNSYPDCLWICHFEAERLKRIPPRTWAKTCERVGLKGKLFHDLRRTAIRSMVRVVITERVAMEISGHKTSSVFDRYDIINEADLTQALLRFDMRRTNDTEITTELR